MSQPSAADNSRDRSLQQLQRWDRLCSAYEHAMQVGNRIPLSTVVRQVPEQERPQFLEQLLAVDWELRTGAGETPTLKEYVSALPEYETLIGSCLAKFTSGDTPHAGTLAATVLQEPSHAAAATAPTKAQERIGDYVILNEIARGGMGVVYKARHRTLNRLAAVKVIRAGNLADEQEVRRFKAEAEAAANLDHPGIVQVFEAGVHDGQHYLAMAYVPGQSLWQRVKESPFSPKIAAKLMRLVAKAVQYAHEHGIIHRDLKPQNILISANGQPRVTDFGLAKSQRKDTNLTETGDVLGTPGYLPPEQAAGKTNQVGPEADVYSLGATLYCLLTGRPPFQAATAVETIMQVLATEPVSPQTLNNAIPRDLDTICMKCLDKNPARRYPTATAMAEDLGRFLRDESILARPTSTVEHAWRWCRKNQVVAVLSSAAAALLIAVAFISMLAYLREAQLVRDKDKLITEKVDLIAEKDKSAQQALDEKTKAELAAASERSARLVGLKRLYCTEMFIAQRALEEGDITSVASTLTRLIPKKDEPDLRGWEWYYLNNMNQRPLRAVNLSQAADGQPYRLASETDWHPNGELFLNCGANYSIEPLTVWNINGSHVARLTDKAHSGRWSPDGRQIAAIVENSLVIFNASDWKSVSRWPTTQFTQFSIKSLAWSPKGDRIAMISSATDENAGPVRSQFLILQLAPERLAVNSEIENWRSNTLAWKPDASAVAIGGQDDAPGYPRKSLRIVDALTGKDVLTLKHNPSVGCAAWTSDGEWLCANSWQDPSEAIVWNTETGEKVTALEQLSDGLQWHKNTSALLGMISRGDVSTGRYTRMKRWDSRRKTLQSLLWIPQASYRCSYYLPVDRNEATLVFPRKDSKRIEAGRIETWDLEQIQADHTVHYCHAPNVEISAVAWNSDGTEFASAAEDGTIEIHSLDPRINRRRSQAIPKKIRSLVWHPAEQLILGIDDAMKLAAWNSATLETIPHWSQIDCSARSICWNESGDSLAVACFEGNLLKIRLSDRTVTSKQKISSQSLRSVCWNQQAGRLAVVDEGGAFYVLDEDLGRIANSIALELGKIETLCWNPSGAQLAIAGEDRVVRIWDRESMAVTHQLTGHKDKVLKMAWHPDGNRIASFDQDGVIRLWETELGAEVLRIWDVVWRPISNHRGTGYRLTDLAWSPDGNRLAASGRISESLNNEGFVRVWQSWDGQAQTSR